MLVIPKEFDPLLHQPDHPHHLLPFVQHSRRAHFELGAAVALAPCPGGAPLAWHGSLIHWGGACSAYTDADPRISLTAALRVRQSAECRARQNHRRSPSSGLISVSSPTRKRATVLLWPGYRSALIFAHCSPRTLVCTARLGEYIEPPTYSRCIVLTWCE